MDLTHLSRSFRARRLTETDVQSILCLEQGNPLFFRYCPPEPTRQSILEDMQALPPGMGYKDKYYIGFFREEQLIAIMDLITGYPQEKTAFIGLFMMEKSQQGRGTGSKILEECLEYLTDLGFTAVRLGIAKGNPQSEYFWKKLGFVPTGAQSRQETYTIVSMEKRLEGP